MLEISTVNELRSRVKAERAAGRSIGFVPTMGYFHEGHLTLMREAKKRADIVVVSVFVNPTQFGPTEDLDKYPRDLKRDREMAQSVGVDVLFTPAAEEVYPDGYATYIDVTGITDVLCGTSRPGHFRGVATVVAKLFNMVGPDVALFGQKDWQQLAVIRRMVADLNMEVEIVGVPTAREDDGLAMSSRNVYLSKEERTSALALSRSLHAAQEMVDRGERDAGVIEGSLKEMIAAEPLLGLEYLELRDPDRLTPVTSVTKDTLLAIAVRVGKARLIDNAILYPRS